MKEKVKCGVWYICDFEKVLVELGKRGECEGVMWGDMEEGEKGMIEEIE